MKGVSEISSAPRRFVGFSAVWILLLPIHAFAADDDDESGSTNRVRRPIEELFRTDVVYPEEQGEFEIEIGGEYQNHSGGDALTLPLSLEYGLTDNWQLEAEWNSFIQHYVGGHAVGSGIGDLEVGSQYSFMNIGGSLFHVAPRFSIDIPAGDVNKDFSEGFIEYEPAVVLARDFPELHKTQIFTEIGPGFVQRVHRPADADEAEPAATEVQFGAGFFTLFQHGAATMEFNLNNNQWNHHGAENDLYVTPGCLWRFTPHIEVGLGVSVGLNHTSDRFDVITHIVYEF
jgi:hypothetical protein